MTLLVLVALGLLSSLTLTDALQATRAASLAEDEAMARAAMLEALGPATAPPDLPWLCLQPPTQPVQRRNTTSGGLPIELRWWMIAPGVVRVEMEGLGRFGARHRRVGWLRPDSLVAGDARPGCPVATRLRPIGPDWLGSHPEG